MQKAEPTAKFWEEEMERCKDPRYFYNNYWSVDGKQPNPLSEEQWNDYLNMQASLRCDFKRRIR